MLDLERVTKTFTDPRGETVRAVDGVSFHVDRGETLCLVGTSGCGKTTTMRLINRLLDADEGTVRVRGEDVQTLDPIRLRRQIGYVVQRGGLFPHMTVAGNIGLLGRIEKRPASDIRERVNELLVLLGLPSEFADRFPRELSGGQQQRVGIARALALDPEIILMDEPFGALDPITRRDIHAEFLELCRQVDKTIILVTHDMHEAFKLGDRIALMRRGRIEQIGTPNELVENPASDFVRRFVRMETVDALLDAEGDDA